MIIRDRDVAESDTFTVEASAAYVFTGDTARLVKMKANAKRMAADFLKNLNVKFS
jgi:hypothetical protein